MEVCNILWPCFSIILLKVSLFQIVKNGCLKDYLSIKQFLFGSHFKIQNYLLRGHFLKYFKACFSLLCKNVSQPLPLPLESQAILYTDTLLSLVENMTDTNVICSILFIFCLLNLFLSTAVVLSIFFLIIVFRVSVHKCGGCMMQVRRRYRHSVL